MFKQNTISLCIVYAFVFLFIKTLPLVAQDEPVRLILGASQTVILTGNGPVELTYTADKPGMVSITAHSLEAPGVIDTTLEVLGPDGYRLPGGFNDDLLGAANSTDSAVYHLSLPTPGSYTIRLNSFNGVSQGSVAVSVEAGDVFGAVMRRTDQETVFSATLPAYRIYGCGFTAAAGDVITITARDTSGTLDPVVTLLNAAGDVVAVNDDHALPFDLSLDTLDAQIAAFIVPDDEIYTVEVRDFLGLAGTFDLTITWE